MISTETVGRRDILEEGIELLLTSPHLGQCRAFLLRLSQAFLLR